MAFQLPKIDLTDAKTRVFLIFGGVIGFAAAIYIGVHFFGGKRVTSGPSKVAGAPSGLQSVPGGQLTPEYYRALVQANEQAAKQAQISGGSAVPTLLNEPGAAATFQQPSSANCTIVCPTDENANVDNDIKDLVKAGKLSPEDGKILSDMAKKNVAVSEYAAQLDTMVKQGKLTPEEARKLLDDYKKQHENVLLQESGSAMDALIKSGQLPVDAANELLDLQKKHVSPEEYANALSDMVKAGRISPETAAQLLAQYTQQQAREAAADSLGQLAQMAASGQIAPDVARELADYQKRHVTPKEYAEELQHLVNQGRLTPEQAQKLLAQYSKQIPPEVADELADYQRRNVPVAEYQAELQRLVAAGKITPEQAQELLDEYSHVKAPGAAVGVMGDIVKQAEKANDDALRQLAESGKISPETAQKLAALQKANVPIDEYKRQLDELVKQGKLDPADAQRLLISYMHQKGAGVQDLLASGRISPDTAQKLMDLQRANVPVDEYRRQLDEMVKEGKISAADAQRLLNNYAQMKQLEGVQGLLNDGLISPETAQQLNNLEKANVPIDEYKRQLDELVKEGKISPADAQKLLVGYMQQKGDGVDDLLKSGKISQDTADKLLALQRANAPIDEYKRQLDQMVKDGKISQADADKLLSNYEQVRGAGVQDLLAAGKISPDTAQQLLSLQRANVPVDEYKRQLDQMVKDGKISQEDADQLLRNYQQVKGAGVQDLLAAGKISADTAQKLMDLQRANVPVDVYRRQLEQMVKEGKISSQDAQKLLNDYAQMKGSNEAQSLSGTSNISPDVEQQLLALQHRNVSVADYKKQLDNLVRQGKITPQQEQTLLANYQHVQAVRDESNKLAAMRGSNVPVEDYAAELNRAVAAGTITPEQAAKLLQEYKEAKAQPALAHAATPLPNVKGAEGFAALQKRIQAAAPTVTPPATSKATTVTTAQFTAEQAKAKAQADQLEQQRLQALMNAMSGQAGQLISSWQPPTMSGQVGSTESETAAKAKPAAKSSSLIPGSASGNASNSASGGSGTAGPIIKAGTIFYAVLETGVNSDYPDSPVMATIVDGKYKGAKLLGKLAITQGQDRVSLTFKLMNMEDWASGKTINAFAVDPDSAKTVLASSVNYHYFMRYGALMASSFLSGYAQAISSSGSTTSLSVTGSTTTVPVLSPADKLTAGLGQVGTTLGKAVSGYTSTPPTVVIDPGTSLGILFMADVSG